MARKQRTLTYRAPTTVDAYTRHRGPYRVMYHEYIPHLRKEITRWSKLRFIRAEDVDRYCTQLVAEEECVTTVHSWTDSGGYFIITYAKSPEELAALFA